MADRPIQSDKESRPPGSNAFKRERDSFVKLAFCRADLLFELDEEQIIVFAAGATPALLGVPSEQLRGQSFLHFIGEQHREHVRNLLIAGGKDGRIDDAVIGLKGAAGSDLSTLPGAAPCLTRTVSPGAKRAPRVG